MAAVGSENLMFDQSFIRVKYGHDKEAIFNPWCSTYTLLEYIRRTCDCDQEYVIDLVDQQGHVRNLSTGTEEYANELVSARETYVLVRIERDGEMGSNKYIPLLDNLDKFNPELLVKLNNLSRPSTRKKDKYKKNQRATKGSPGTKRPSSSEQRAKQK
ncbi:hypothetical protein LOTGIDRAFT_204334 [Lottia gigantea]|uniref:Uncharacterized protein n=1 Tax=Lottia gigantea TaxID=225164 RepID=V3ZYN8_LOTGI|nr:hypothetical protein LOTGIDRAFT_204334 [Lottia gigantea]ESO89502.1 hypothetical protein LOTGIDRAFT_204334 [Lottia gigantea]